MTVMEERPVARDAADRIGPIGRPPEPRRRRIGVGVAIAIVALIALLALSPALASLIRGEVAPSGSTIPSVGADAAGGLAEDAAVDEESGAAAREVAITAELRIEVASPADAADRIGEIARQHDGYVERLSVSGSGAPTADDTDAAIEPAWATDTATLRVPSDDLDAVLSELSALGDVLGTNITREDVTATAVDLRARIASAQASIARLQELMAQAGSVADLLEVEAQLAQRQSELEAYESELEHVEGLVSMSTVHVALVRENAPAPVEPGSPFLDGLLGGWNALVASFGALITVLGFALPWLVPVAIVWGVIALVRRRRRRRTPAETEA